MTENQQSKFSCINVRNCCKFHYICVRLLLLILVIVDFRDVKEIVERSLEPMLNVLTGEGALKRKANEEEDTQVHDGEKAMKVRRTFKDPVDNDNIEKLSH